MLMYGKLFSSLYQGTLRGCSDEILVFTNLIAHADMHGIVDKHWRSIAEETGLDIDRVKAAIINLEAPDPESRSPEEEGRRILPMDEHRAWGWKIVNHGKYRSIKNEDDRREQNRIAQQKWREKQNKTRKPSVSTRKHDKPPSAHTDTDTEEEEAKTVFSDSEKEEKTPLREIHCGNIVARIMKILDVPKLHNHFEWIKQADIAFSLGKTEDEFIETFTLLRGQKWRSGSVKPSAVTDNLPNLTLLRQQDAEINGKPKVKEYSDDERKMREMVLAGKEMFYGR